MIGVPDPDHDTKWVGAPCLESDPDLWFPEHGGGAHAKLICRTRCPKALFDACLAEGLAGGKQAHGIWGGTNERDRAKIRRQIAAAAAAAVADSEEAS